MLVCFKEAQIGVLPSIVALKALLQASRLNPIPSVSEIWTHPHSVCCVASQYFSYRGCQ